MKKIAVLLIMLLISSTAAFAQMGMKMGGGMHDVAPIAYSEQSFTEDMRISRGGQLYDNWWKATVDTAKPEGDHPLWNTQTNNKRKGYSTYRCKECHGWDYRGKDGAYNKGSHFTGFTGIYRASQKMSMKELEGALKGSTNKGHDFSTILSDADISDLALFMKKGAIDITALINENGMPVRGNMRAGSNLFKNTCTHMCHGIDGTMMNFGDKEKPEFVSTIANKNPWEFIHKVRSGQPGTRMISAIMNQWSNDDLLDILSFARTLPKSAPEIRWYNRMMNWMGMGERHHGQASHEDYRGFGPIKQ